MRNECGLLYLDDNANAKVGAMSITKAMHDPNTKRLRAFILLVIFVVTLPSLMLSGFGLIAIRNERSAAYRQMIRLYRPVMAKVQDALMSKLSELEKDSAAPLASMARWGARKEPPPSDSVLELLRSFPSLVNFFVMDEKGKLLPTSSDLHARGFSGFLPERFLKGRRLEFQSREPCKAVGIYRALLGELDGSPARCAVFQALNWRLGNSSGLQDECEKMLGAQGLDSGLKCITRGALARSLDGCGQTDSALEEWERLSDSCPRFVNAKGYNLALGARLRMLELLVGKNQQGAKAQTRQLVSALADPMLPASLAQRRFVARRAAGLIVSMEHGPKVLAYEQALRRISRSSELFEGLAGIIPGLPRGTSFRSLKVAGTWRMLVVNRSQGVVAGAEIVPGILELGLGSVLDDLDVGDRVMAQIRSADQNPGDDEDMAIAATWLIPKGQYAWRLNLALVDKGQMEDLANARTRLYAWVLVLLVLILVIGIAATVWIMVRETRLSRLKTDFVSNVSHELRTPLTSIRLFTDTLLLGRASDEDEKREFLQIISTESDRLSRLVEKILDFSRMEAGRKAYVFESVEVRAIVDAAMSACSSLATQSKIQIDLDIPGDIGSVYVDFDAMVEVVINLLSNAIKYSPTGSRIEIYARTTQDSLTLSVKDQGIGIPKSEREKIFEKFYRVETPLASDVSGSGLGLSLVKYIVQGHGGSVQVLSGRSKGSTFTVRLPLAQDNEG